MTIANDQLISDLSLLGLDKNDARVYLAALEIGPARVWDIAKLSGIKRPTCYLALEKMVKIGLAQKDKDKKHMTFAATEPKDLEVIFEERKRRFQNALNELQLIADKTRDKPRTQMLQGVEGLEQAFDFVLKMPKGSEILMLSRQEIEAKNADFAHEFLKKRVEGQIKARGVFPDAVALMQALPPRDQLELRKSRFIPKNIFDPNVDVTIFSNKVIQVAYTGEEPYITVIENQAWADDERQRFEILWELAQEPKTRI